MIEVAPTLTAEQIVELTGIVRKIPIADHIARYALKVLGAGGKADPAAVLRDAVARVLDEDALRHLPPER